MSNNENHKDLTIHISSLSIIKVVVVLLILIFLYLIKDVVLILFIAIIISSAITPWVDELEKRKIPRFFSILAIYLIIFGILSLAVILIIPPIAFQLGQLASQLPYQYHKLFSGLEGIKGISLESAQELQMIIQSWGTELAMGARSIFSALGTVFGGFASFIIALIITFYVTLEKDSIKKFLQSIIPIKYQAYAVQLSLRIQEKMGSWLKGQLFLCFIIGLLCYIGLEIIGIKYALVLALIAAITEIIPYVGPWLGGIPAVILAFVQSPVKALFVIILYLAIQQFENSFIVPGVMKKIVGLNPIMTIIAISIGGKLAGVGGAVIAIPVAVALSIVAKDILNFKKDKEAL